MAQALLKRLSIEVINDNFLKPKHIEQQGYLSELLTLLRQERDEDRQQYIDFISSLPLSKRIEKGYSWSPLQVLGSGFTVGDKAYIIVERTSQINEPHQMRSGMSVRFFTQAQHAHRPEVTGVINFVHRNKMKIILTTNDLPDWVNLGQLGVDTLFDERTYQEMEKALVKVMAAERDRLTELRDIFLGKKMPSYREDALSSDESHLNKSQNEAMNRIINTYDVAILHGPPGTGKTTTLVSAIKQLSRRENTILVAAPSNAAADLLTERLAEKGLRTVRIGNISRVDDSVVCHTLDYLLAAHEESRHLKKVRIKAAELRKKAGQYKRSFGHEERLERRAQRKEAAELMAWANELENRLMDEILTSADAICCTLVGAAHPVLEKRKFRTVFIDEAAQALEPATWIPILKASRVILAGDPYQLPPTVKSYEASKKGLSRTLLERCLELFPQDVMLLDTQYRMHSAIMGFSNHYFYDGKLKAHASVESHTLDVQTEAGNLTVPLVFVDTAGCGFEEKSVEKQGSSDGSVKSRYNPEEALLLREHLLKLIKAYETQEEPFPSIAIITPYREQVVYLENMIQEDEKLRDLADKDLGKYITINTVDGFQGQERDVVYISLVRSNPKGDIGFLSDYRRMNVAMTRARKTLIVIGDSATIGNNRFYSSLLDYCEKNGRYETAWAFMS